MLHNIFKNVEWEREREREIEMLCQTVYRVFFTISSATTPESIYI